MNIQKMITKIYGKRPVFIASDPVRGDNGLTSRISSDKAGVKRYSVEFADGSTACFIGKRKSVRIIMNGIMMASAGDPLLALLLVFHHKIFGYSGSSLREAQLYSTPGLLSPSHIPELKGYTVSHLTGRCFLAMEVLPESDSPQKACLRLLDLLAEMHAEYFGKADRIPYLNSYSPADYRSTRTVLRRMFDRLSEENEAIFGKELTGTIHRFIARIDEEYSSVEARRTLTHNDCCDRNISISGDKIKLFDWELACCQNPEHDVAELLISIMETMSDKAVLNALEHYRNRISDLTGVFLSKAEYWKLLRFNTMEFCVNKLCVLRLAGKQLHVEMPHDLAVQTARMIRLIQNAQEGN